MANFINRGSVINLGRPLLSFTEFESMFVLANNGLFSSIFVFIFYV